MQQISADIDRDLPWLRKNLGIKSDEVAKIKTAVVVLKEWARFSRVSNHRKRLRTMGRRLVSAVRAIQRAFRAYISRRDAALETTMIKWSSWWGHLLSEDAKKERKEVVAKIRTALQVALKDCGLPTSIAEIEQLQQRQAAENMKGGSSNNLLAVDGGVESQPNSNRVTPRGSRRSSVATTPESMSFGVGGRRGSHQKERRNSQESITGNVASNDHLTTGEVATSSSSKANRNSEFYEMLPPHVTASEILKFFDSATTADRATQVDYYALMDAVMLLYKEYSLTKRRHQLEVSKLEKLIRNEGIEATEKPSDFFGLDFEKIKRERKSAAEHRLAVLQSQFPQAFEPSKMEIKERYIITSFCHNVRLIGVTLAGSSRYAVAFLLKVAIKTLKHKVPSWNILRMYPEVAKVPSQYLDEHATAVTPLMGSATVSAPPGIRRKSLGGSNNNESYLSAGAASDGRRPSHSFVAFATTLDPEDADGDGLHERAATTAVITESLTQEPFPSEKVRGSVDSLSPALLSSASGDPSNVSNAASPNFQQSTTYWRNKVRDLKPCGKRPTKAPWCNRFRYYFELRNAEIFVENENLKASIANNAVAAAAANAAVSPLARRQSLAATYNTAAIQKRQGSNGNSPSSMSPGSNPLIRGPSIHANKRGSNTAQMRKGRAKNGRKLFSKKSVFDDDGTDEDFDSDDSETANKREGIEQRRMSRYHKAIRTHNHGEAVHRRQSLTAATLAAAGLAGNHSNNLSTNGSVPSPGAQFLPPRASGSVSSAATGGRRSTGVASNPALTPETVSMSGDKKAEPLMIGDQATSDPDDDQEGPVGIMHTARGDHQHNGEHHGVQHLKPTNPESAQVTASPSTDTPLGLVGEMIRRTDSGSVTVARPMTPSSLFPHEETAQGILMDDDDDISTLKPNVQNLPDKRRSQAGSTVSYYQEQDVLQQEQQGKMILGTKVLTPEMVKYLQRHARILGKPSLMDMKAVGRGHVRVVCKPRQGNGVPQGTEFRPESSWGANNNYNMTNNSNGGGEQMIKRRYNSVGGRPQTPTNRTAGVGTMFSRYSPSASSASPTSPLSGGDIGGSQNISSELAKDRRHRIFGQHKGSLMQSSGRPGSASLAVVGDLTDTSGSLKGVPSPSESKIGYPSSPIILGSVALGSGDPLLTQTPTKTRNSSSTGGVAGVGNSFSPQMYKTSAIVNQSQSPSSKAPIGSPSGDDFTFYPSYAHIHNSVANGRNVLAPLIVDNVFSMAAHAQQKPKTRPINGPPPITGLSTANSSSPSHRNSPGPQLMLLGSSGTTPPTSHSATPTLEALQGNAPSPSMLELNVTSTVSRATPTKKLNTSEISPIISDQKPTDLMELDATRQGSKNAPLSHVLHRSSSTSNRPPVFKEALDEEVDKAKKRFWKHMRM